MTGTCVKVLVVDDDPAAREFMTKTLEAFGYTCRSVRDGVDALEKLQIETFDLLVTGLDMPRLDGLGLIERVRATDPDLPIVILTSRADFESGQQALRLGVSDYLVRPVDNPEEIQAAARRAVENKGTRDEVDGLAWEMACQADQPSAEEQQASYAETQFQDIPRIRGYRDLQEIGKGGVGTVYKAVQIATQRTVAMKVLPFSGGTDQDAACLVREMHVASRLQHPNIIRGYDAGLNGGYFYVAMEYVAGEALGAILDREGAMSEPRALDITRQMVSALTHAWEIGLVHRDIKPHNIILTHDGVAKLADLGITRDVTGMLNTISSEGMVLGTPLYISPEQAQGMGGVDWRADVYSLGATLYHMVTGAPPFDAKLGPSSLLLKHATEEPVPANLRNGTVSLRATQLIEKMMRKDRQQRYESPDELMADCEVAMQELSAHLVS